MKQFIEQFLSREDAAVTVDWVVITAAITGFGVLVVAPIWAVSTNTSTSVGAAVSSVPIDKSR